MDGYYAFMLVATALVLMMTVPALALFYGGMTRSKSVLNMMMMSYVALGDRRHRLRRCGAGRWASATATARLLRQPVRRCSGSTASTTSNYIYVMFQLTFAVITVALISGAIADRVKFSAWVVFVPLWVTLCYFPIAHMVFSCTDGLAHLRPHRRPGLRRRHGGPHQRRCRRPGPRAAASASASAGQGPMRPHNLTAHHARRRPAVVRLVRLQRRLDRLHRRSTDDPERPRAVLCARPAVTFAEHHPRHHGRDARLADHRARSCTARPPRWVPPPASSRVWSRSRRPAGAVDLGRCDRDRRHRRCASAPGRSA